MEIPQTLYSALLSADEDYLIALCNKGTVNRAKKDLSAVQPEITQTKGNRYRNCGGYGMHHHRAPGEQHLYLPQQHHVPPPDQRHFVAEGAGSPGKSPVRRGYRPIGGCAV